MLEAPSTSGVMETAFEELAPHKICAYIYELANAFNRFYHETRILAEEDKEVQKSYIALLVLTKKILESCIDVLALRRRRGCKLTGMRRKGCRDRWSCQNILEI